MLGDLQYLTDDEKDEYRQKILENEIVL